LLDWLLLVALYRIDIYTKKSALESKDSF